MSQSFFKEFFAGFICTRAIVRHFWRLAILDTIKGTTVMRNIPSELNYILIGFTLSLILAFGINVEQAIKANAGVFLRAMQTDGRTETPAFPEVDQSVAGGISLKGASWGREQDTVGVALIGNALSRDRRDYLQAGGISFFIGDGALHYRPETILESYYNLNVAKHAWLTADYQHIANPAYNADRGPVDVFGVRLHLE